MASTHNTCQHQLSFVNFFQYYHFIYFFRWYTRIVLLYGSMYKQNREICRRKTCCQDCDGFFFFVVFIPSFFRSFLHAGIVIIIIISLFVLVSSPMSSDFSVFLFCLHKIPMILHIFLSILLCLIKFNWTPIISIHIGSRNFIFFTHINNLCMCLVI